MEGGPGSHRQPFSEHIREMRQRLLYCVVALLLGSSIGYALHDKLFALVRQPLHQKLYYTSPVGGFNSMLKLSILFGLVLAIPVVMYQLCQFLKPVFRTHIRSFKIIFYSVVLAATGVSFAYFVSLPAAVHFLTHVDTKNLQPFIVVNDYLNFVFSYLAGFAILFQLPLVLLVINRIKPQSPKKLMGYERYVIIASFVVAAMLTPTPDPINQMIMAGPIILLYQFSVILVWRTNRKTAKKAVREARDGITVFEPVEVPLATAAFEPAPIPAPEPTPAPTPPPEPVPPPTPTPPLETPPPRTATAYAARPVAYAAARTGLAGGAQPRLISDILY